MEFTSDKELGFSLSGTLLTGGWQGKFFGLNLFDFGHADISAYVSSDDIYVGAFASVYSPDFSFTINGTKIELGLELGSIGGKFRKQGNKKTFQAGMLFGFTISWE